MDACGRERESESERGDPECSVMYELNAGVDERNERGREGERREKRAREPAKDEEEEGKGKRKASADRLRGKGMEMRAKLFFLSHSIVQSAVILSPES